MRIYNFPIKDSYSYNHLTGVKRAKSFQPVDLDYIVSVGPVSAMSYTGSSIGESFAYFDLFIKIGQSIRIVQPSGTALQCPDDIIQGLQSDRLKLIEAWGVSTV
jgi:hypothetical protein